MPLGLASNEGLATSRTIDSQDPAFAIEVHSNGCRRLWRGDDYLVTEDSGVVPEVGLLCKKRVCVAARFLQGLIPFRRAFLLSEAQKFRSNPERTLPPALEVVAIQSKGDLLKDPFQSLALRLNGKCLVHLACPWVVQRDRRSS